MLPKAGSFVLYYTNGKGVIIPK